MTLSRLFTYAAAGIIVGLLLENKGIRVKHTAEQDMEIAKRKVKNAIRVSKHRLHLDKC